jgi:hypothetical protein
MLGLERLDADLVILIYEPDPDIVSNSSPTTVVGRATNTV